MALVLNHEKEYVEFHCDHFANALGFEANKFAKQLKFSHMFAKILYFIVSLILCLGEPTFDDIQTVIIYEAFVITNLIISTVIILKSKKSWK